MGISERMTTIKANKQSNITVRRASNESGWQRLLWSATVLHSEFCVGVVGFGVFSHSLPRLGIASLEILQMKGQKRSLTDSLSLFLFSGLKDVRLLPISHGRLSESIG
jgi:hypothetical protein